MWRRKRKGYKEMRHTGKPFAILLNCVDPNAEHVPELRDNLYEKYNVPVIPVNCSEMEQSDVNLIMRTILYEFPICEIGFNVPQWMESLDYDENLKVDLIEAIKEAFAECDRLRSVEECANLIENAQFIKRAQITEVNAGKGTALIELAMPDELFYKILSDRSGLDINDDRALINMIKDLGRIKKSVRKT